jgi:hypothetical protein
MEKDTSISCFRYRTYMNNAAICPHIFMYGLQLQNIKRDSVKKHDITALNKKVKTNEEEKHNENKEVDNKEVKEEEYTTSISDLPSS